MTSSFESTEEFSLNVFDPARSHATDMLSLLDAFSAFGSLWCRVQEGPVLCDAVGECGTEICDHGG
jgi:hypothetical protein